MKLLLMGATLRPVIGHALHRNQQPANRNPVLHRLTALLMEHQEYLALLDILDTDKPIHNLLELDITGGASCFDSYVLLYVLDKFTQLKTTWIRL